jgi:gluconolactonase
VRLYTYCGNESMAQPNDIAVAARSGRIYVSGGRFDKVTTEIGDGDLWVCERSSGSFYESRIDDLQPVVAKRLGLFGITNGIELSPDERTLYMSESFRRDGLVTRNVIWRFTVDPSTGAVSNRTLFVDFKQLDGTEWVDVDGIRSDLDGNLFVARNGPEGEVVKFSPNGQLLLRIKAHGLIEPTNLDLAGVNGSSLFIVGKCVDEAEKGCVDVWHGNPSPGRAWTQMRSSS